jgi:hypothetical protein
VRLPSYDELPVRPEAPAGWNTQVSTHWDGFRHVRHPEHGFYGGVADEEHGVHHWARHGIAGRAVLCDVDARWTCLLVSAPLNLAAGVASPANAITIR